MLLLCWEKGLRTAGCGTCEPASNSSSAALWVIKQVERRTTLLEKYKVHDHDHDAGIHMDQASTLPLKYLCQYLTPPSRTSSGMRFASRPTRRGVRSTFGVTLKIRRSKTTSCGRDFHRSSQLADSNGRPRPARRCHRRGWLKVASGTLRRARASRSLLQNTNFEQHLRAMQTFACRLTVRLTTKLRRAKRC